MSVRDCGRDASLENILSRVMRFVYSRDEAGAVVDKMVETVMDWRNHFASLGCQDSEIRALGASFARSEAAT